MTAPTLTPRSPGSDSDETSAPDGSQRAGLDPESSVVGRSTRYESTDDHRDDRQGNALVASLRFVYRHSTALVPASVLWVVCSLPLVTVGPASLGVYTVVLSLRETGRVDRSRVRRTVRSNFVAATLLGFAPVTFLGIAGLYVVSGLSTGLAGTVLTLAAAYVGLYLNVLLIPTFVLVAAGGDPRSALRESYLWIATNPATALWLGLSTLTVFVVTLGLTVGFLLLFAGVAGVYHVEVITRNAHGRDALPSLTRGGS